MADIWGDVTGRLQAAGFDRTSKDKMKNVKQYYKDLKDGHNRSCSNWPYYDLTDDVLGYTRPRNIVALHTTFHALLSTRLSISHRPDLV